MMHARQIVNMPIEQVWATLNDDGEEPIAMTIAFDDGEYATTNRDIIFSRYFWEFQAQYPQTPILIEHLFKDLYLSKDSTLHMTARCLWAVADTYGFVGGPQMEDLMKLGYDITNALYNDMTYKLEEFVGSICAYDFLDVIDHEKIKDLNNKVAPNEETLEYTVDKVHAEVAKILKDINELPNNSVANAAKTGLVSLGQILQCVSARGYVTDIDGHIFKNPILQGFAHGIVGLEDHLKESRSASKALYYTKGPVAASEYLNRNIQHSAATLSNLHFVDCGSKEYIEYSVKPGDLTNLEGIHRLVKELPDGAHIVAPIRRSDKHLMGKVIKIRSVFGCKHPDPYGICVKCFGDTGLSVPYGTNIGWVSSTALLNKVGQNLLSTKHEDGSANVEEIILSEYEKKFIHLDRTGNEIYLNDTMAKYSFKLIFLQREAQALFDLPHVETNRVDELSVFRMSEISAIELIIQHKNRAPEPVLITTSTNVRKSSFSHHMLHHLKNNGWTLTADGKFEVSMDGWDFKKPLFELPLKHFSTVDFMKDISAMLKSTSKQKDKSLKDLNIAAAAVNELDALVNSKLDVSLSHLQVIVLSLMVRDIDNNDYRLPIDRSSGKIAKYNEIMMYRSLSAAMAYQNQTAILFQPSSFTEKKRPAHPLDDILMG